MITANHLQMRYPNGFLAVKNLNLQIEKGDIYGFLGPNGAGKTTTIRMLTGLLKPTGGTVRIDGVDPVMSPREVKRKVGVLPESHGFYYSMNAEQYLRYFAELYGLGKDEGEERLQTLIERVGLKDKKKVPIGQYSRGMKQRLGIAKTMVHLPEIIFLDEPTLGLDPIGQRDIYNLILDINRDMNVTVFITSHLLKDIEILCNRICIVKQGELLEEGCVKDLKESYGKIPGWEKATVEDIFFYLTDRREEA